MSYLDEYGDPSEDMINDWNIHNDHQGDNVDVDAPYLCGWCDAELNPDAMSDLCDNCANEYDSRHPHPLDIAEREELESRSFGLDDPPWRREF